MLSKFNDTQHTDHTAISIMRQINHFPSKPIWNGDREWWQRAKDEKMIKTKSKSDFPNLMNSVKWRKWIEKVHRSLFTIHTWLIVAINAISFSLIQLKFSVTSEHILFEDHLSFVRICFISIIYCLLLILRSKGLSMC